MTLFAPTLACAQCGDQSSCDPFFAYLNKAYQSSLTFNPTSVYTLPVNVGTSGQVLSLQVDSGSSDLVSALLSFLSI